MLQRQVIGKSETTEPLSSNNVLSSARTCLLESVLSSRVCFSRFLLEVGGEFKGINIYLTVELQAGSLRKQKVFASSKNGFSCNWFPYFMTPVRKEFFKVFTCIAH